MVNCLYIDNRLLASVRKRIKDAYLLINIVFSVYLYNFQIRPNIKYRGKCTQWFLKDHISFSAFFHSVSQQARDKRWHYYFFAHKIWSIFIFSSCYAIVLNSNKPKRCVCEISLIVSIVQQGSFSMIDLVPLSRRTAQATKGSFFSLVSANSK